MTRLANHFAALCLLVLFGTSCTPREPTGEVAPETPPEEPAVTATPVALETGAESPPVEVEEPLSLRFVSPNLGPPEGGNEVTIDGVGFADYPRVTFGGEVAWIRFVTATEVRVLVPSSKTPLAGKPLVVDVKVANPPVGSAAPISATLPQAYSYVDPDTEEKTADAETAEEPPAQPSGAAPAQVAQQDDEPSEPEVVQSPSLVASFSFEELPNPATCPAPGIAVRFTDRSTGGPTGWVWDFGDGKFSQKQHLDHCYTAVGMRSVTLTVNNTTGSASTSKIVTAGM